MIPQLTSAAWWWVGTAVGGSLVLLVAAVSMRRNAPASARQRLGEWGILAAMLLAALRLGPSWLQIPAPWTATQEVAIAAPQEREYALALTPVPEPLIGQFEPPVAVADAPMFATTTFQPTAPQWVMPIGWLDGLLLGYLALATYFTIRWIVGQWGLARLLRRASPAPADLQALFASLAPVGSRVRLVISDRVSVPMCCGLWRPTVILPRILAQTAGPMTLRWVFAHELTHVERRDPWSCWLMGLAQAIYFYVPWFWWLRRQIRLCQEYVADAAAVAQGPWADDYAQFLVSLARSPVVPLGATGVLGNHSDLYRRVAMVLNPTEPRTRWSRGRILIGALSLLGIAVFVSGLGLRAQTPPETPQPPNVVLTDSEPVIVVAAVDDDAAKRISELEAQLEKMQAQDAPDNAKIKELKAKLEALRKEAGATKKRVEARIMMGDAANAADVLKHVDKKEVHKKVHEALEKAKLSDEQIKEVMKEFEKIHVEQMKVMQVMPGATSVYPPRSLTTTLRAHMGGSRLGIEAEPVGPVLAEQLGLSQGQGLVVHHVTPDSSAEKAGIKANDILLSFAGKSVSNDVRELAKAIEGLPSDKEFEAVILRKGKKETISGIKLAEAKKENLMFADVGAHGSLEAARLAEMDHAAFARPFFGARGGKSISININNGELRATEADGDLTISVRGKMDGKKATVSSVMISEPGVSLNYDNLDNVPEKYRERVKKLLNAINEGPAKTEAKSESR